VGDGPARMFSAPFLAKCADFALTPGSEGESFASSARYSVVLLAFEDGGWRTLRVYDNHLGTHHMHRYTRKEGKQPESVFHSGPTNEAIPAAINHLKIHWKAIIESWRS